MPPTSEERGGCLLTGRETGAACSSLVLSFLRTAPPHSEMAFAEQLLHLPGFPCMSALAFRAGFRVARFVTIPLKVRRLKVSVLPAPLSIQIHSLPDCYNQSSGNLASSSMQSPGFRFPAGLKPVGATNRQQRRSRKSDISPTLLPPKPPRRKQWSPQDHTPANWSFFLSPVLMAQWAPVSSPTVVGLLILKGCSISLQSEACPSHCHPLKTFSPLQPH